MFRPLVSIVIPVYNGANYVAEAIDSALAQTYDNFEVIVVNDGSRDDGATEKICLSYGDRIRYFHKENGGVATALNYGIEQMRGEYFSWLSHDDKYKPGKVARQIEYLALQEDKTVLLYGGYENFNDKQGVFETMDYAAMYSGEQLSSPLFPVTHLALNGCTLLIHKSHFDRVGGFDPGLPTTQDYDLWFRMFRGQQAVCLPGCQVLSRSHPEQGSRVLLNTHIRECTKLWNRVFEEMTEEEKEAQSGSLHAFYNEHYDFFTRMTGYVQVQKYLRAKMIQALVKEKREDDPVYQEVCKQIRFGLSDVKNALQEDKTRSRIVFYMGNVNAGGGMNRIILNTADKLTVYYDVFIVDTVHYDGTGYAMGEQIHEVTVVDQLQSVSDAVQLLDADVFIGSYNCDEETLMLYNMLLDAGVNVAAWSHEHYILPYANPAFHHMLNYRMDTLKRLKTVIWLTGYSAAIYGLHAENGMVIPNMVSFSDRDNEVKKEEEIACCKADEKVMIGIGRFDDPRKKLDRLISVFAGIYRKHPNSRLLVVGPYNLNMKVCVCEDKVHGNRYKTIRELIREAGIPAEAIHFTGEVKDVKPYYEMADIHLMTSVHEGFGLVINEAAYYAVPTIAFAHNGYEDIISDGISGYIAENENEMTVRACELLSDADKCAAMGKAAKERLVLFSPENVTAQWRELIDHLASDSKHGFEAFLAEKNAGKTLTESDYKAVIREMDWALRNASAEQTGTSDGSPSITWKQHCEWMESTFSWKITKPLRIVTKIRRSIKAVGVKNTVKKTADKLSRMLRA